MKIVHLINSIDPAHGGPTAVVLRLAAAQATLGHDVTIASNDRTQGPERAYAQLNALGLDDKQWVQIGTDATLQQAIDGADMLHTHGVWCRLVTKGTAAARKIGVPYAVTPHGMLDPWCLAQKTLKKKIALALFTRRMINGAAFIHVLNKDEGELIMPLGLTARPITIPNGVSLDEIDPLPEPGLFRKTCPQLGDRPFVLFLSRLHHKKGLDYLADAFKRVIDTRPDTHLVVAGPDGGAQKPFEGQIKTLGIQERVLITGPIYGREKLEALVDADVFCLPSRQEGFSIAVTEALACGLPAVISEDCHFPEVAQVGAGRVCKLSADAVGEALIEILGDAEQAKRMGAAGRALIESRYTWPRIAERCVQAYRGAL